MVLSLKLINQKLFTLRLGKDGFIKTMSYSKLSSGQELIDDLHKDRFFYIKLAGLNYLEAVANAFEELHLTNPIDYDLELTLQKESQDDSREVAIQNEALIKKHSMLKALALKQVLATKVFPSRTYRAYSILCTPRVV